jgi:hypothetical protein
MGRGKSTERSGMSLRNSVFRSTARAGTILCLLLAALSLVVNDSEYPGYTPSALRYMTGEVLPLTFIGFANLAALDAPHDRARYLVLLALVEDVALLVYVLPRVITGAPPFAFMLAGVGGMLVLGTLGMASPFCRARSFSKLP